MPYRRTRLGFFPRPFGVHSINVGCMQVNLIHHPDAFTSLDHAHRIPTITPKWGHHTVRQA